MNNKRTFIGCIMLFLLVTLIPVTNVSAKTINDIQSELNKIDQQQKDIKKQRESLNQDKSKVQSKLNENVRTQNELKKEIKQIDDKLISTKVKIEEKESEIFKTNKRIDKLTEQLEQLAEEIEEITDRIEKRELLLKKRLRSIQENGGEIKFIEVLLGAQNFVDFISRSTAVNTIMGQDQTLIEEHTADKIALETKEETVKLAKVEVEEKKVTLEGQKEELLSLKSDLDKQVATKGTLLAKLEKEYNELDDYRVSIEDEQKAVAAQASSLEKAKKLAKQEQARLKTLSQQTSVGGNGTFIWPANGRRSSSYGARIHPIYKTRIFHHGLDIATPVGTPLKAAGSGVVSVGRWMGGYGNVIMITHMVNGQQLTTVYAHLSKVSVSPGQTVQQGQIIGATGNTGDSTGPHLHFEVHKGSWNGSRSNSTNPIHYLP